MSGAPEPVVPGPTFGPGLRPLTVTGLLLLDPHGHDPTVVESMTFDDDGIGVVRSRGQAARVLPWEYVITHAVEPWAGGVIPEWWVAPAAHRTDRADALVPDAPVPDATGSDTAEADALGALLADPRTKGRALPHAEAGAMISIQTRTGTYRFLRSGGDPTELATRIAEFTVRHRGPAGISTVTTVAPGRHGRRSTWGRVHPWLVVLLIAVAVAAITVILLQSAGVVHLPFLGSGGSGGGAAPVPISP